MSREIKIRAWDNCAEKMIIAGFDDGYTFIKSECGFDVYGYDGEEIHYLELMEYTGLKDKNGVEIYEGDIVYIAGHGDTIIEFPFIELYEASYENDIGSIIGNIYENPELLKD